MLLKDRTPDLYVRAVPLPGTGPGIQWIHTEWMNEESKRWSIGFCQGEKQGQYVPSPGNKEWKPSQEWEALDYESMGGPWAKWCMAFYLHGTIFSKQNELSKEDKKTLGKGYFLKQRLNILKV